MQNSKHDWAVSRIRFSLLLAGWLCGALCSFAQICPGDVPLADGWQIQSAALANQDGPTISSTTADTAGWHPASVPETVLSALVKDGTYTNIYFGKNLEAVPTAPFTNAWWYRRQFTLSA